MLDVQFFSPQVFAAHRLPAEHPLLAEVHEADALFGRLGVTATANAWLLKMEWKRVLAHLLVGDLLEEGAPSRNILEVGGSLSALTLRLARQHRYRLLEMATHESAEDYRKVEDHLQCRFVTLGDWSEASCPGMQDVIIANDIFPNVDQRLYEFVEKFLPWTRELRMTLTYYEGINFKVRRIPSGELLTVKPWGLREVTAFLDHLAGLCPNGAGHYDRSALVYQNLENVLFTNRRNILRLRLVREPAALTGARSE